MKKFLLLLLSSTLLFGQFEDDYYIISGQNELGIIKDYNIVTNTLNSEYNPHDWVNSTDYVNFTNFHLLTYIPNSDNLFFVSIENYLSDPPESFYHLVRCNPNDLECKPNGYVGYSVMDILNASTHLLGIAGKISNGYEFYGLRNTYTTHERSVHLVSFNTEDRNEGLVEQTMIKDISDYVKKVTNQWGGSTYYPNPGLAFNPDSKVLYFIGENSEEQPIFYSYDVNSDQMTELSTNFGEIPFYRFNAMHFMRGQNKIMMADNVTGKFYTYDLNTNLIEIYAETSLTNIVGIVNKHDFLGNVEVYNQGEIKIYPNPVKENLHVETNSKITKIELFNIIGQKLREFNSNSKTLNLSKEHNGVYILKIQMENGKIETKKIIKN